ncbi:VanZ family protein [uncultured Catenibacterium sp.]|uniref:VanZ family protein n=1 Tax=uncultured Catenibacterium sp. TaxID=286142 RepID=UPI0025F8DA88|nr:VanZ family protein [uncultured Catenibacterium sp.]
MTFRSWVVDSIAFIIYLVNLIYQLFLNPALRRVKVISSVNISPLKTIFLYYTAYERHTLPIKNIILNMIGNVILFMPFGYFVYVLFKPMRSFLSYFLFFLFMIIGVEVIQYIWKVGSADIDDIILNMSGVLILYIIMKIPFVKKIILNTHKP